jgi:hypothetical protein
MVVVALAFVLCCAAVGCGSRHNPASRTYSLVSTKACLNRAGIKTVSVKNPALSATEGNLQATFGFGTGQIDMAFGRDTAEARALEAHAVMLAERHLGLSDHKPLQADIRRTLLADVRVMGNVFYYSPEGPVTAVVNAKVVACLR